MIIPSGLNSSGWAIKIPEKKSFLYVYNIFCIVAACVLVFCLFSGFYRNMVVNLICSETQYSPSLTFVGETARNQYVSVCCALWLFTTLHVHNYRHKVTVWRHRKVAACHSSLYNPWFSLLIAPFLFQRIVYNACFWHSVRRNLTTVVCKGPFIPVPVHLRVSPVQD